MKPGGLWDKYDAGQTGFAALGYNIPESMPPSAHQYGSFYNSSMHKFRNQEGTGAFRMWRPCAGARAPLRHCAHIPDVSQAVELSAPPAGTRELSAFSSRLAVSRA